MKKQKRAEQDQIDPPSTHSLHPLLFCNISYPPFLGGPHPQIKKGGSDYEDAYIIR